MDETRVDWNLFVAIWMPIIWPFLAALVVYAFKFRSVVRSERYWLVSLVYGFVSVILVVTLGEMGLSLIAVDSDINEWGGHIVSLLTYIVPVGISVWAVATSCQPTRGRGRPEPPPPKRTY